MNAALSPRTNIMTIVELAELEKLRNEDEVEERFLYYKDSHEFNHMSTGKQLQTIMNVVCEAFGVTEDYIKSNPGTAHKCYMRDCYYYVAKNKTPATLREMAAVMGLRNANSPQNGAMNAAVWVRDPNKNPQFITYWQRYIEAAPKHLIP